MESGTTPDDSYSETDTTTLASWTAVHKNDDETHVSVQQFSKDHVTAIAVDVDADNAPVASHLIAVTQTTEEAKERAIRWMEDNPKGIESGGLLG